MLNMIYQNFKVFFCYKIMFKYLEVNFIYL